MKVIDLSGEVFSGMEVYPGDPEVKISSTRTIKEHGYTVLGIEFGTHTATHIDTQSHMHEGGKTLSDYDVGHFVGKAILVEKEEDVFSAEVLIIKGKLFSDALMKQIIALKPKMVGFGIDSNLEIKYEKEFLKHDILTVGPLDLEKDLPNEFLFCAFPLKIKGGDASPVRAVALCD